MDLREVPKTLLRRHPWEVARARFFRGVLEREGLLDHPVTVLDVGAGDGYLAGTLLEVMSRDSRVTCFDALYTDDDLARLAGAAGELGWTGGTPIFSRRRPTEKFGLLLLLDVLEHVPDDRAFLHDFVSHNLVDGGTVLVSVPAWPLLFSEHDVKMRHFRRYRPIDARRLLEQVGLELVRSGGLLHGPMLVRMLAALGESLRRRAGRRVTPAGDLGQWNAGPVVSRAVERLLFADNVLSHRMAELGWSLPGLSFWALGRRQAR
jgi:hypothetical protein